MTLVEARRAAATAIRDNVPAQTDIRVFEVDVISARDLPNLIKEAEGLRSVSDSGLGEAGPALVAVMAQGREQNQTINITAFTLIKNRLVLNQGQAGLGRGLAVVDIVEKGLSTLRASGLPDRFIGSEVATLPRDIEVTEVRVFLSRCMLGPGSLTVPSPLAPPIDSITGGAPGAIRKRVGEGITDALGLITPEDVAADPSLTDDFNLDLDRLGNTEARYRAAIIAGLIPRCKVDLKGIRRTEGGGRDVGVGRERWIDTNGGQWSATCSQQPVIVTVSVWDRTLNHADRDAVLIASALNGGYVTWPGEFDAWVLDATNVMVIEHRTNGTYRMEMRVAGLDRAEWDDEQGLARAGLAVEIQAIDPLEAATEGATATSVENTGAIQPRIPEVNIGDTLDIDLVEYFGHFALPVGAVVDSESRPTSVATVAVTGTLMTVTGVAAGQATITVTVRVGTRPSRSRRTLRVTVIE